jgi:hypothetical protein
MLRNNIYAYSMHVDRGYSEPQTNLDLIVIPTPNLETKSQFYVDQSLRLHLKRFH